MTGNIETLPEFKTFSTSLEKDIKYEDRTPTAYYVYCLTKKGYT